MFGWVPRTERIANVQDASVWAHQRVTQFALKDDSLRGGRMYTFNFESDTEWRADYEMKGAFGSKSRRSPVRRWYLENPWAAICWIWTPRLWNNRSGWRPHQTTLKLDKNIPLGHASHAQTLRPRTYQMNFRMMVSHKCRQYSPSVSFSCATEYAEITSSYEQTKSKSLISLQFGDDFELLLNGALQIIVGINRHRHLIAFIEYSMRSR